MRISLMRRGPLRERFPLALAGTCRKLDAAVCRELMQFLQAANWMWLSLPNMTEVESPLRALLERTLKGTTRTTRVASRKVISEED